MRVKDYVDFSGDFSGFMDSFGYCSRFNRRGIVQTGFAMI